MQKAFLLFSVAILLFVTSGIYAQDRSLQLWYTQPAEKWTDALPIGNGRLGAMIFGGVQQEHLQFNEQTLWTGSAREYARKNAWQYLPAIRQLLFDGKQKEAEALSATHFMGLKDKEDSVYTIEAKAWLAMVRSNETAAAESFNDNDWQTIDMPLLNGWETGGMAGVDGALWFRNSFELPAGWQGKDLYLDLGRIRDEDYTYVNGKLVGNAEGISTKRHYKIPASLLHAGKNSIAVQVINYYDKGGFTGVKTGKSMVLYPDGIKDTITLPKQWRYFIQNDVPPSYPQYQASYQPFGDLHFEFYHSSDVKDYRRSLDISKALATVSYTAAGVHYKREYFASHPQQAIVMRFTANKVGRISMKALFSTLHGQYKILKKDTGTLMLQVQVKNGALNGTALLHIKAVGGKLITSDKFISVQQANEVVCYVTAATNFVSYNNVNAHAESKASKSLQAIKTLSYNQLVNAHVKDYQQYFNCFAIRLGNADKTDLPTDQRVLQYTHQADPGLLALYMQYGRYLFISSSRNGGLAPNLQGIWNDNLTPSWGSKYTTNINLEMNYWPADLLNLQPLNQPLFDMLTGLAKTGAVTAKEHYNLPGWVLHHNTDIWLGTAPINNSNHGIWPTGSGWLAQHIWDHYLFTKDQAFLRKYYPVMKQAAVFYNGFLVKDPGTGKFISTPSNSPEHGGLVAGPTMDHQIIRNLFGSAIQAASILNQDKDLSNQWQGKMDSLLPNEVGPLGELKEWIYTKEDTTEKHRHVSHLWGVFPGTDISWKDSALMKAARQSMLYRGDDGTGWSLAWKVNIWARLKEGDHALLIADKLLSPADAAEGVAEKGGVYKNLFDAHPPFQIDGNFGGAAGIGEMLVQSHDGVIEILPALPEGLPDGEVKGICARGGFQLDIQWAKGSLTKLRIYSVQGGKANLVYADKKATIVVGKGGSVALNSGLQKTAL